MGRKSILQFIESLRLNKSDQAVLIRHVEDCHVQASGPDLHDRCTDKVRRFLELRPPPAELSWKARIKLEDALNAGFTSKEAYQMGIPAIGVVAVLVASVAFTAWIQAPGGGSPSWAGCAYPMFTAFLIVNGFAFMLSLASVIVVTAFPLVLNRTPHQAAWWGGILLIISLLAFIVAFLLAGFVTVGYGAPDPTCASLKCTDGGIKCTFDSYQYGNYSAFPMDSNVAVLDKVSNTTFGAECYIFDPATAKEVKGGEGGDAITTVYPSSWPDDAERAKIALKLLSDPLLQAKTVCADIFNIPDAFGPDVNSDTLGVNVLVNISFLQDAVANLRDIADFMPITSGYRPLLWAYPDLSPYFCMSNDTTPGMKYPTLCDITPTDSIGWELSVNKAGNYLTSATAASNGAVTFGSDVTARQVSMAIKILAGVFALILLIIVIFLLKSKWF